MKQKGLNKRLLDRRNELYLSTKEACIMLDISKIHLYLIERGYIRVSKKLQPLFVYKYKLEEDFFNKEELKEYPTPIEMEINEKSEEEINSSNFRKKFTSWPCRIILFSILISMFALFGTSFTERYKVKEGADVFYDQRFLNVRDFVKENGTKYDFVEDANIPYFDPSAEYQMLPKILTDTFYSFKLNDESINGYDFYVNFFEKNEYLQYTFLWSEKSGKNELLDMLFDYDFNDDIPGNYHITFETRIYDKDIRTHLTVYDLNSLTNDTLLHTSFDFNSEFNTFKYNLLKATIFGKSTIINDSDSYSLYFKNIIENLFNNFYLSFEVLSNIILINNQMNIGECFKLHNDGVEKQNRFSYGLSKRSFYGLLIGIISFGTLILTFAVQFRLNKKLSNFTLTEEINAEEEMIRKPLPINNFKIKTFIPEIVIRIAVICFALLFSIGFYKLFDSITDLDFITSINNAIETNTIITYLSIGMLLMFFLKQEKTQKEKDAFTLNFLLLCAGFFYYIAIMTVRFDLQSSSSLLVSKSAAILNSLPGNFFWGVLAFSLFNTFLNFEPKFKNNNKKNIIIFRFFAIIPFLYLLASIIITAGTQYWNWNISFELKNLLFVKAIPLTVFAMLYAVAMAIYKVIINKKFGNNNSMIYSNGHRSTFIKNSIAAGILLLVYIISFLTNGFDTNELYMLIAIPFILFYRPHLGVRKIKADLAFIAILGFSFAIGFLLILNNVSVYLLSL